MILHHQTVIRVPVINMCSGVCFFLLTVSGVISAYSEELNSNKFPDGFMFGTATSAFQTEGAWNENDKGENIWDRYTHKNPDRILDGTNADIACDSYHKLEEDLRIIKDLRIKLYRFSLSWSRILPKGFAYKVSLDGIRYYNQLIDLLVENDIIPMVTMFHWDTPQPIEDLGGFSSALVVDWFEDYSRIVYEHFGDRVKYWITFNDPKQMCQSGYGTDRAAPGYKSSGIGDYMCAHNVIKSHARAYHLYNNTFKVIQQGRVSIATEGVWYQPATNSLADIEAANRAIEFELGWFTDPIYHPDGDYPLTMRKFIGKQSQKENFPYSRLPRFNTDEVTYIKGTYDYFALNHYGSRLAKAIGDVATYGKSFNNDVRVEFPYHPNWNTSDNDRVQIVPWGFRMILNYIKNRYGDLEVIITENGFLDHGGIDDQERISYLKQYLSALLDAIYKDKVRVTAYTVKSLLDSFEWENGYRNKYGLYHVNFSGTNRTRTPKSSVVFYRELIVKKKLSSGARKIQSISIYVFVTFIAVVIIRALHN